MENEKLKEVKKTLAVILFLNIFVAILKVVFGYLIKSSSMTADGFHSMTDGLSNVIGLIGIHFAAKPADKDHPYGHYKFESMASLFIGGMLTFLGINVIREAIPKLINPTVPETTTTSLVVLIITVLVNIFVASYELKKGKSLNSEILISDSHHTRSDIYISVGVLLTLILIRLGVPAIIDPIVSLVVAVFILHAAYEIFEPITGVLVDRAVIDPQKVKDVIKDFDHVKECHRVRSRGKADAVYVDLHLVVDSNLNIEESHNLTHEIEESLKEELNEDIQVLFHLEPEEEMLYDN
ncbi:MAG: cation diffusion facilitator family transporter [Bacillota bacterium]